MSGTQLHPTRAVRTTTSSAYDGQVALVGDLHNHCGISYGHGSLADALANAALQLDFVSVTGHAQWHDMPTEDRLAEVADYHRTGFAKLAGMWDEVQRLTAEAATDDLVTFLSYEWHSCTHGDHCVYYRDDHGPLLRADSLDELRSELRKEIANGRPAMVLPHHVGYPTGYRGANWDDFSSELTPVAEVVSMHGGAVSETGPRPYLHTMGPLESGNTAHAALQAGLRFGFIGSTDHHSAHPGSHGYGRAMVWAPERTRNAVWQAIQDRRTYAVTGDPIILATTLDQAPMGATVPAADRHELAIDVTGLDTITQVAIVRDGEVVQQWAPAPQPVTDQHFHGVLAVTVGWGETGVDQDWDIAVRVDGGVIESVEPRLHGLDTVDPLQVDEGEYHFSSWQQDAKDSVRLHTRTVGNPTVTTDQTQGLALVVDGSADTVLEVIANGQRFTATVADLRQGGHAHHLGGFLTGGVKLHRAIDDPARCFSATWVDESPEAATASWYAVQVSQANNQHAWNSPHFVGE